MTTITQTLTTPTTAPTRSMTPDAFNTAVDNRLAWESTNVTEHGTLRTQYNTVSGEVSTNATTATTQAAASAASAVSAAASAAGAAASAAVTKWISGTTYALGDCAWSPANFQTYRRKIAGGGVTDPSADGTNWALLLRGSIINKAAAGALEANSYNALQANAAFTLPSLVDNAGWFGIQAPSNATAVPTSVTSSDGWDITTGFVAGTFRSIAPLAVGTAKGLWLGQTMTPPVLATITGSTVLTVVGTAQIDTNLVAVMFRDPNGTTGSVYVVAINTLTNTAGAVATLTAGWNTSANAALAVIYSDSTSSFVASYQSNGAQTMRVYACSINISTLAITVGTGAVITGNAWTGPLVKLTNGLYAFSVPNASDLYAMTVSGTTCTVGTVVASGSLTGAIITRQSNTEILIAYAATGGGSNSTRALSVRVGSISGTTITLNAAVAGSNIYRDDLRILKPFVEGTSYLLCCADGTVSTTGNYHGVTVSGTVPTLGTISAKLLNLPAAHVETTYIYKPAIVNRLHNASTILMGHMAAGPIAATISGSTITIGASGGPATITTFVQDVVAGTTSYAIGSANFDKLSVSAGVITSAWQVVGVPTIIESDTLTDKVVSYSGTWYTWTLPTAQSAIMSGKWLFRSGNNLTYSGSVS